MEKTQEVRQNPYFKVTFPKNTYPLEQNMKYDPKSPLGVFVLDIFFFTMTWKSFTIRH